MITNERVRLVHTVEKNWKLYSYRETIVSELEEINSQHDIDFVVDKLKDWYYWWAVHHWLELEAILNHKKENVQPTKRRFRKN